MGSLNDRLAWQPSSSSGNHERCTHQIDYLLPDMRDRRALPRVGRSPWQNEIAAPAGTFDTNLQLVLIIQDDIRRYSIEGMFRSLDIRLTVQFITDVEDLSMFRNGQLLISSRD